MTSAPTARRCPDGGACHHRCEPGACWRAHNVGPLSGVYTNNRWPDSVSASVPHIYMSTSCLHSLHVRCADKGSCCKFCGARCVCQCHRSDDRAGVSADGTGPQAIMEQIIPGAWPVR